MKRTSRVLTGVVAVAALLAGCSGTTEPAATPSEIPAEIPAEEPAGPAPSKAALLPGVTCDDCVYELTCPNKDTRTPQACGSFQWKPIT